MNDDDMIDDDKMADDDVGAEAPTPPHATTSTEGITPKQEALRGLLPEWRERLVEQAAAMGIRADHDIAWLLVKSFINAWAAAAAAGDAADRVESGVSKIQDTIYNGALNAGNDIAASIKQSVGAAIVDSSSGLKLALDALRKKHIAAVESSATLAARERGKTIVIEWQKALNRATSSGVAARMAKSWGVVAGTIAATFILGIVFGYLLIRIDHRFTPSSARIYQYAGGYEITFRNIARISGSTTCPPAHTCISIEK